MWEEQYEDNDKKAKQKVVALSIAIVLAICFLIWSVYSIHCKKKDLQTMEEKSAALQAQLDESLKLEEYDEQTGVLNEIGFKKALEEKKSSLGDTQLALYYISFASPAQGRSLKSINDDFGHLAGRDAIMTFAGYLKATFPEKRFICSRLSGSTFMVLDTEFKDREDTLKYIKKMKALWHDTPYRIDETHQIEGMSLHTTAFPFKASVNSTVKDLIKATAKINHDIRDLAYFTFKMEGDAEPLLQ